MAIVRKSGNNSRDREFITPGDLKSNRVKQLSKMSFECNQCYKTFTSVSKLKSHEMTHLMTEWFLNEKPFSCYQCNKKFAHLTSLKTLEKVHTGEKPFSCSQCDKKFTQLGNLKKHERKCQPKREKPLLFPKSFLEEIKTEPTE